MPLTASTPAPPPPGAAAPWSRILGAALLTALTDGLFSSALNVAFYHSTVARLWQGVASVLLGAGALDGGTRTAAIGLALHFGVALTWSLGFGLAAFRLAAVRRRLTGWPGTLVVAAVYGPIVWLTMSLVVIPAFVHRGPSLTARWWIQFFGHMIFVGLPIVATIGADLRRRSPGVPMRALLLLIAAGTLTRVNTAAAQGPPPMPQRLADYCEGESCHYGCRAVARRPLEVKAADERRATVIGHLREGDTVRITTGNLWLLAPGIVVLARDTVLATDDGVPRIDTLALSRGDTLYLLAYGELGNWTWWVKGRSSGGFEFWSGPEQRVYGPGRDSLPGRLLRLPRTEYWLHLDGGEPGRTGWWLAAPAVLALLPDESTYCAAPF